MLHLLARERERKREREKERDRQTDRQTNGHRHKSDRRGDTAIKHDYVCVCVHCNPIHTHAHTHRVSHRTDRHMQAANTVIKQYSKGAIRVSRHYAA